MDQRALRMAVFALAVAVAALAGATQAAPRAEAGVAVNNINWRDCSGASSFEFECGTVRVPLRHGRIGQTVDIAVIRHRALDPSRRIGVLLMNPGGPGGSGVQLAQQAPFFLPLEVLERFDIIGFDPRGVGRSSAVDCIDGFGDLGIPDPTPDSQIERKHFYEALRAFAEACRRRSLPLIQYVDTESAARDMEYIRVALGEETLSYLGFSYGTSLGATYAGLYPERVRAFVLDGAIDPTLDAEGLTVGSAVATERAFRAFLGDCLARPECGFRAGDGTVDGLLAAFDELLARTEQAPIPSVFMPGPPVGPGELLSVALGAMYEPRLWPLLATALGIAYEEDDAWLIANFPFSSGPPDEFDNIAEAFPAINCADYDFPRSEAENDELLDRAMAAAPRFGAAWLALTGCVGWPVEARASTAPITAAGAPPILVIGTTLDPATPYEWAVGLAGQLESGVLVTHDGAGHTAYGKSSCVGGLVSAYLLELVVPEDGVVCRADTYTVLEPPAPAPAPEPPPAQPPVTPASGGGLPTGTITPPDTGQPRPPARPDALAFALAGTLCISAGCALAILARRAR